MPDRGRHTDPVGDGRDDGSRPVFSRRGFLRGVVGAGALAAAGSLAGCHKGTDGSAGLMVPSSSLVTTDDLEEAWFDDVLSCDVDVDLDLGTMAWGIDDQYALLMQTGEGARPLNTLGLFNLQSGSVSSLLDQAVGADEGFDIYEARASSDLLLWTEVNYSTYDWRVYCSPLDSSMGMGSNTLYDQGPADFMPPLLCACGDQAVWTVSPDEEGAHAKDGSVVKARSLSEGGDRRLANPRGYLLAIPERSDGVVTTVMRADTDSTNYQLLAQRPGSGEVVSQVIMPPSVRPMDAILLDGRFAFQIEASFSSNSAIAQMGTYFDIGDGRYLRINRVPSCTPALHGGWLITKSGKATLCIDPAGGRYVIVDAPPHSLGHGDYLATSGACGRFLVYSTVTDENDAAQRHVQARVYSFK